MQTTLAKDKGGTTDRREREREREWDLDKDKHLTY